MIEKKAIKAIKENLYLLEKAYKNQDQQEVEALDERLCIQLEANNIPYGHDLVEEYHNLKEKYRRF